MSRFAFEEQLIIFADLLRNDHGELDSSQGTGHETDFLNLDVK